MASDQHVPSRMLTDGFDNNVWDLTELKHIDKDMIWDKEQKQFVYDQEELKRRQLNWKLVG
jgi:hypothetical protein